MKTIHTLPDTLKEKVKVDSTEIQQLRQRAADKESNLRDILNAYILGARIEGAVTLNNDFDIEYEVEDTLCSDDFVCEPVDSKQVVQDESKNPKSEDYGVHQMYPKFQLPE